MNRKNLSLIITSAFALLTISPAVKANYDRYDSYVNYDLLCESADGLQYVAHDLKDCFSAEFRRTGYYGKLVSRTNRIKHTAKRLHRRGLAKSTCNWRAEIQTLDDLVCELDSLVDKAVHYNRGCSPICPATLRKVRSLIRTARRYVDGLERSLREIEYRHGSNCHGGYARPLPVPAYHHRPHRYNDVAPGYIPRNDLGRRGYRPDVRDSHNRYDRDFASDFRNIGFDLGGLRFTLK